MTLHESPGVAAPAPVEVPEAAPDLDARLDQLAAAVATLREELRAADERSAGRDRMIERLHQDNQALRAGERRLLLQPVLTDLQRLRNDLIRQARSVRPEVTAGQVAALLDSYAQSVELTLDRGGVSPIRPECGDAFDGGRHRPAGVLPASRPDEDGRIAVVLSEGYLDTTSGRVLTPATVRVHRWTGPATATLKEEDHV